MKTPEEIGQEICDIVDAGGYWVDEIAKAIRNERVKETQVSKHDKLRVQPSYTRSPLTRAK